MKRSRAVLKKMGSKTYKVVNKIKVPGNELLGSHTRGGKAIALHEKVEHEIMKGKKQYGT